MPTALLGLIGLAVVIAVVVGVWRWAHADDYDDGYEYDEVTYYEERWEYWEE